MDKYKIELVVKAGAAAPSQEALEGLLELFADSLFGQGFSVEFVVAKLDEDSTEESETENV